MRDGHPVAMALLWVMAAALSWMLYNFLRLALSVSPD